MSKADSEVRLTTVQAIVRYLAAQFIEIDGKRQRLCGGGFGIFGHGNVTCLGEALYDHRDVLPLYRGQNEQGMGFCSCRLREISPSSALHVLYGISRSRHRQSLHLSSACPCEPPSGPDALRRCLCDETAGPRAPATRTFRQSCLRLERWLPGGFPLLGPDHPSSPNHPVPASSLCDHARPCRLRPPFFLALPQDIQGWAYDYPTELFDEKTHHIRRQSPDSVEVAEASALLKSASRPVIIAGGGVQYSGAVAELTDFAETHGIPVVETIAGRANPGR